MSRIRSGTSSSGTISEMRGWSTIRYCTAATAPRPGPPEALPFPGGAANFRLSFTHQRTSFEALASTLRHVRNLAVVSAIPAAFVLWHFPYATDDPVRREDALDEFRAGVLGTLHDPEGR